ncbi:type IV pilus biogenesis/stability protein PilW [Rheinheimera sp. D18]|uniref:type IV pilus biogenesis/stability protein PilW n=1 Tax=Rheinheimera sp. D18 TaxID=2545632 RepID=UPI0010502166|nr:type IV pilus biogenesis/stability protein PilW [Rheinheimera sp. D18]QBL10316.1 type IV pilus biogenesis/stability protein PilW [Rheinheimera sp. D18]
MQKVLIGVSLCSLLILTGCVSEQSYVGSDKPVSERTFDNIEAARTRISLGLNYLRRGDTSQAKYNLERARSFAPNSAEVYSALAYYYQSVAEDKQAEEYFRLAIQKDNNYADAYNNYGAFLCQLHRYDEAEQLLLKAISRPGYIRVAESYENLALCQLQQNNFSKVKHYLDLSISHNTTRITALTMAAGLAYAMGDNKQAKTQLDRIQRLGRVSARTVLLSYLLAEKSGDREIMRSAEQLLITLYIETPETRMFLQGKLQDSEFEQLRERYKDSLMANIVLPDENAPKAELPSAPVANPKLKVVKRKNDDSSAVPAVVTSGVAATQNSGTGIANSLVGATTGAVVASLPNNAQLPAETIKADIDYKKQQDAARAKLEAQQQADAQAKTQQVALDAAAAAELAKTQQVALEAKRAAELAKAELVAVEAEQAAELAKAELVAVEAEQAAEVESVISENVATPAVESESSEQLFHIVQASESLYSISLQHNIRLQRLMDWNQLTPDSVIKTGEKIWLGPVSDAERIQQVETKREQVTATEPFHTVSKGETMFGISYRYNLRLSSFMSWNNFTENSKLTVGQQVYIIDPASATQ